MRKIEALRLGDSMNLQRRLRYSGALLLSNDGGNQIADAQSLRVPIAMLATRRLNAGLRHRKYLARFGEQYACRDAEDQFIFDRAATLSVEKLRTVSRAHLMNNRRINRRLPISKCRSPVEPTVERNTSRDIYYAKQCLRGEMMPASMPTQSLRRKAALSLPASMAPPSSIGVKQVRPWRIAITAEAGRRYPAAILKKNVISSNALYAEHVVANHRH